MGYCLFNSSTVSSVPHLLNFKKRLESFFLIFFPLTQIVLEMDQTWLENWQLTDRSWRQQSQTSSLFCFFLDSIRETWVWSSDLAAACVSLRLLIMSPGDRTPTQTEQITQLSVTRRVPLCSLRDNPPPHYPVGLKRRAGGIWSKWSEHLWGGVIHKVRRPTDVTLQLKKLGFNQ